jgi:hypothetical protein
MPLDVNKLIQIALVKRAQDLQEARSQRQSGLQEKHDEAIIAQMQEMIASSQQQRGVREGIEQLLKNIRLPSPPAGEGFAKNLPLRGGMGALGQMGPAVAEAQGAQKRRRADITELATRGQFGPGALALSPGMAGMQLSFGEATRQAPRIAAGLAPTAAQAGGLKLGRDQLLLQEQQQTLQGMFEALRTLPEFPTEDFSDVTDMKGLISKIGKAGLTTMGELDAKYKVLSSLVTMRGQDFGMKIAEMNNLARVYVAQGANPEAAALKARADMMNALLAGIKNIGAAVEAAKTAGNNKGARNLADGMSQLLQMSYDFMGYDVQVEGEPPGRFFGHGLRQPLSLLNAMGVTGEQQGAPDLQTMIDQAIAGAGGNVDSVLDMVIPGATAGGGAGGAGRTAPLGFGARAGAALGLGGGAQAPPPAAPTGGPAASALGGGALAPEPPTSEQPPILTHKERVSQLIPTPQKFTEQRPPGPLGGSSGSFTRTDTRPAWKRAGMDEFEWLARSLQLIYQDRSRVEVELDFLRSIHPSARAREVQRIEALLKGL